MALSEANTASETRQNPRLRDVWLRLDKVCDPELDEPITDMGFVEDVEIDDNDQVFVRFRLPTYWCSANFAYLMASDIRLEVGRLDWVSGVRVKLEDHMFEEQVNTGVNEGRSFREIFAEFWRRIRVSMKSGRSFARRPFSGARRLCLLGLQGLGFSNDQIVSMTLAEFDAVQFRSDEDIRQQARYRDIINQLSPEAGAGDLAFRSYEGSTFEPDDLGAYLSKLRGVRINMEFSGALCRGLLSTRYKELDRDSDEPDAGGLHAGPSAFAASIGELKRV